MCKQDGNGAPVYHPNTMRIVDREFKKEVRLPGKRTSIFLERCIYGTFF